MNEEQKPDTTEAVAKVLSWQCGGDRETARSLALFCIAAHNEELARQGFVVVKPVKVKPCDALDTPYSDGWNSCIEFLIDLGLPIEVIE